jgi:hypothetical protein
MAIKIDDAVADALTLRIAEGIPQVQMLFGLIGSDFEWVSKPGSPLPDNTLNKLYSVCGEQGIAAYLHGEVQKILVADPTYEPYETETLSAVASFSDPIAVARGLVAGLKALPYSYRLSVPLPEAFSKAFGSLCANLELGSGVSIIPGSRLLSDFPARTGVDRIDSVLEDQSGEEEDIIPKSEVLYLVQRNSGYVGQDKECPILNDFRSTLRQFLGISTAVGLIQNGWGRGPTVGAYVAHRLPQQILRFYTTAMSTTPTAGSKEKDAVLRKIEAVKSAFGATEQGRKLSVAAIWYLRSLLSQESLDALLEATISIEALFGGGAASDGKTSSILANRCAYRIGSGASDRQQILENFSEIYSLRSRIVHEGHHRFNSKERMLLKEARELCRRSLVAEAVLKA